jgi:hypothetical protein
MKLDPATMADGRLGADNIQMEIARNNSKLQQ